MLENAFSSGIRYIDDSHCAPNLQEMSDKPTMSPATKELLKKVRMIVPPMLEKFHKGDFYVHTNFFDVLSSARPTGKDRSHWRE